MSDHRSVRLNALALATGAALSLIVCLPADAGQANLTGVTPGANFNQFIVKYKDGAAERSDALARKRGLDGIASAFGKLQGRALNLSHKRRMAIGYDVIRSDRELDSVAAEALIRRLAADPNIESVQADAQMHALFTPNDPLYPQQWHYYQATGGLNLPPAWDIANGSGVTVAVIDSGILGHADLNANLVAGYDFVSSTSAGNGGSGDGNGRDADPTDSSNVQHGTHVAGTIAATTNNGVGVAGVAFGAKVSPLRVLGNGGYGSLSDIADAIVWASGAAVPGVPANANPAKVINLSLGGGGACDAVYQNAINTAVSRGTVLAIAAGNSNSDVSGFRPANCANVIAIAANDIGGNRAYYSNYGAGIDVTAPGGETAVTGEGVLSTVGGGSYGWYQGTSMAAPHVAGVAALILGRVNKTPAEVESILKSTARALPGACAGGCGAGIVNAAAAVNAVSPQAPALYAIYKQGASAKTEVHALNGADGYQSFLAHTATALSQTGADQSWLFDLGDYNGDGVKDLYSIAKQGASGRTEVHVLNGADGYQSFLGHIATGLSQTGNNAGWLFNVGDYNRDGKLDLYAIARQGASGKTEVHVLNGADGFQTFLTHTATALSQTGAGNDWAFDVADYNRDGVLDLYAFSKQGASGKTEVHVLNGADGYQSFLTHLATGLHQTGSDLSWTFDLGDYNGDGTLDLYAIARQGGSGRTEAHVLDGAGSFQNFSAHIATALQRTGSDGSWLFLIGQR